MDELLTCSSVVSDDVVPVALRLKTLIVVVGYQEATTVKFCGSFAYKPMPNGPVITLPLCLSLKINQMHQAAPAMNVKAKSRVVMARQILKIFLPVDITGLDRRE